MDSVLPECVTGISRVVLTVSFQGSLTINTLEQTLENLDSLPVTSETLVTTLKE